MNVVYIALGSNLGVSSEHLNTALEKIAQLPNTQDIITSPWYKTTAIGGPDNQPDYINAVCRANTTLEPMILLRHLQAIESLAGRTRDVRWGPRTLDLDIIWYEDVISHQPDLILPHPRAHERAFVLRPLIDLKASFQLKGQPLSILLNKVAHQIIEPYAW